MDSQTKQAGRLTAMSAIEDLREMFPVGSTVHMIQRHTSRSGMSRSVSVISPDLRDVSHDVAEAIGRKLDQKHYGVKCAGCGTNMGFDLVYSLSSVLYRDGFTCIGEDCPSNDHINGDRDYTPHHHSSGGYALNRRWL